MTKKKIMLWIAVNVIILMAIGFLALSTKGISLKPASETVSTDQWSYIEVVGDNGHMVPCVRQNVHVGNSDQLITVCDWDGIAVSHNNYGK